MILRRWTGRASPDKPHDYPRHFHANVVPELRKLSGFIGATLSCRSTGDLLEFEVISRWESMDAIRAFAGKEPVKAVVEPGAVAALIEFDATVAHATVLEEVMPY